jgi:Intraflagellar transport protein 43
VIYNLTAICSLKIMEKKGEDSKGQDKGEGSGKAPRRRERQDVSSSSEGKYQSESVNEAMQSNPNETTKTRRKRGGAEGSEGGWMTMSDHKSSNVPETQEPEVVPQATNKNKHFEENNDEIMIIPDLEEDGNENDQRIAHAPRVVRKIPTLAELESDVKATTPTMDSGFDLGVLLTTLVPVSLVVEEDAPWTFESLLRDVTDELLAPNKMVAPGAPKETSKDKEKEKASKTKDKEKEKHKEKSGERSKEGPRK